MGKLNYIIIFAVFFVFGIFLLFTPTPVGTADNSDFTRVVQPIGLTTNSDFKFYYFQDKYDYVEEFDSLFQHVKFIIRPNLGNHAQYKSTQFLPIKIAQLINGLGYYIKDRVIRRFDIRTLGILLLLIHCIALSLLWRNLRIENKWCNTAVLLAIMLIFFDMGYLVYYNSFFGEGVILASFLLWFASMLHLAGNEEMSYTMLITYFFSGTIFIGAKVANIPLGIGMVIFTLLFFLKEKQLKKRILISVGILFMIATSVYYYISVPDWMGDVNKYHSLFFGVLRNSENPQQDLKDLGIDAKYAILADTHGYGEHAGYDIHSDEFREDVYKNASPTDISKYYIMHPGRLLEKMNTSAAASLTIRPPHLGNYTLETSDEIVRFSKRFSLWEDFRKTLTGLPLLIIVCVFLIYIYMVFLQLINFKKDGILDEKYLEIGAKLMLIIFAAAEFILPIVGNGESELIKHMFLFNVLFDTMLIMMFVDILKLSGSKKSNKIIFFSALGLLAILIGGNFLVKANPQNDILTFGKYQGSPLEWEVLEKTSEHYLLVSKNIITNHPFSTQNSNLWAKSDMKTWLNDDSSNGFLCEFTIEEKNVIATKQLNTVLAPSFKDQAEFGHQPHYWYSVPGKATQNYENSYRIMNEERVFLLSIKEWETYKFNRKKGAMYWLRTPYTDERVVRVVGEDGYVYHKLANMEEVGVVPAMYIKKPTLTN